MEAAPRPADEYADYRFFRFLAVWSARFTISALAFLVWYFLFYRGGQYEQVPFFLGATGMVALAVSLVAAMVSYMLYKRRGGKVEKTPPPAARSP